MGGHTIIVSRYSTPAARNITAAVRAEGPITFARFMELALYDPEVGYYMRPEADLGREGDYVTSPEVHPAFGLLLCTQFEEMWRTLDEPAAFWLIEGGPGRGTLIRDVLRTAGEVFPRFAMALRIGLIESSPSLRRRQQQTLGPWAGRVTWIAADSATWEPLGSGCVFANELLDALPVHRVVMTSGGLREIWVALHGEELVEIETDPSTATLQEQIAAGGGQLGVGHRGEVNVGAPSWVGAAAKLLDRGYVLLFDYGAPADQLYGTHHPRGTLRCYYRHTMNEEPLTRIGLQDITAHVDFSAVTRAVLAADWSLLGATEQWRFLGRLGVPILAEDLDRYVLQRAARRAHRAALDLLVHPQGLGQVLAVAYGRNVPALPLAGFTRSTPLAPPRTSALWPVILA